MTDRWLPFNRGRLWRLASSGLRIAGAIYLIAAAAVYFLQSSLMYFPTNHDKGARGVPPFDPWLSSQGEFYAYVRDGSRVNRVVVLFHGNAGEALDRSWLNELVPSDETALVLAEYPGYGPKKGSPSQEFILAAAVELLQRVRERWSVPITLLGESLGTGVASAVASESAVERIALISPFSSTLEIAQQRFPFLPLGILMRDKYPSTEYLSKVRVPLFVVHGDDDDVIPLESGQRLFESYLGASKFFVIAPGISHNNIVPWLLSAAEAAPFRAFVRGESD